MNWPKALVRELADRRVVIFVGSGISRAAKPDMPLWPSLIEELAKNLDTNVERTFVKGLIRKDKLLDAAEVVTEGIGQADLHNVMRNRFQILPPPEHEIYHHLLRLDAKTVVTTNYDQLIEKNFATYSGGVDGYNVATYTSSSLLDSLRSPSRTIVKMHGCISDPSHLVLSRTSYFNARRANPGFFSILGALFTVSTVLFIGYSLSDPDLQIILENIHAVAGGTHPHYALVPKAPHKSVSGSVSRTYNIRSIEYPPGEHAVVPTLLGELYNEVNEMRAEHGIV